MKLCILAVVATLLSLLPGMAAAAEGVRLKNIARIEGVRTNSLTGYGLVIGLSGTGDTSRSKATQQSVVNALLEFGVSVQPGDVSTRNAAAVIVTAELPAFAQAGDKIDVVVSSLGDARSLVGGTLLLAPLRAANGGVYALAQGQVSIGGFKFDLNGNVVQKNHPTTGIISNGAAVEREVAVQLTTAARELNIILNDSDFTTASRVVKALNKKLGDRRARAVHAGRISVAMPEGDDLVTLLASIENTRIRPDIPARIVINERTGTVVSGGSVKVESVTISHGNIKLTVATDFVVSQPSFVTAVRTRGISSIVVPDTEIDVEEDVATAVDLPDNTTIADLVTALRQIKTSTRDIIVILQAIKAAGALHAELVVQ